MSSMPEDVLPRPLPALFLQRAVQPDPDRDIDAADQRQHSPPPRHRIRPGQGARPRRPSKLIHTPALIELSRECSNSVTNRGRSCVKEL